MFLVKNMNFKKRLVIGGIVSVASLIIFIPYYFLGGSSLTPTTLVSDKLLVKPKWNDIESDRGEAHLPLPRKDLDMSNYTSDRDNVARSPIDKDKSDYDEREAVDFLRKQLLKDPSFLHKKNLQKLLVAADVIKSHDRKTKVSFTKEFLPQELEEHIRSRTSGKEQVVNVAKSPPKAEVSPFKNASIPTDPRLDISEKELNVLLRIKSSKEDYFKKHPRQAIRLHIYDDSDPDLKPWQRLLNHINQFEFYGRDDPALDSTLHDLATQPIVDCVSKGGGTQVKLTFFFQDGNQALFKPMRFPRDVETQPNHYYFNDFERHNAEIGAFHLDRVLDFRRVPPCAGRTVNMTWDIKRHADRDLYNTFYYSPVNNVCFFGKCDYYCDSNHPVCGNPDMLEGSFAQYLPSTRIVRRKTWRHPWRRSYSRKKKADWEMDNTYCNSVRTTPPYNTGRRLLDLMDLAVFDFLMGNLDRHHYETIYEFGNFTSLLHLDNGRGFGKPNYDDLSIIAPIYQCCLFRYSTLHKLLAFQSGPVSLSEAVKASLEKDKAQHPVLAEKNMVALDRRVRILLKTVYKCIQKNANWRKVVIDDGF